MTCSCNSPLIVAWTAPPLTPCARFNLRGEQVALIGDEMVVKGYCRLCNKYHAIRDPEKELRAFIPPLRIPVESIAAVAIAVKVRR